MRLTEFAMFVRATRNAGLTPITPRFDYESKSVNRLLSDSASAVRKPALASALRNGVPP
jgi:hypothetical protein